MAVKTQKVSAEKHDKGRLMTSERYKNRKDLLAVLLTDDGQYSFDEVDKMVDDFMKGKVK